MEASSTGLGFMAAFAVSGSLVLIVRQVHKRLLSYFMKQIELELAGSKRCQGKKRVRFAEDVVEPSSNNQEYRKRHMMVRALKSLGQRQSHIVHRDKEKETNVPLNRQTLYRGVIEYRCLKGYDI